MAKGLWNIIREKIGYFILAFDSKERVRRRTIINFDAATSMLFVYYAGNLKEVERIAQHIRMIKARGKKVNSIGYVDTDTLPVHFEPTEESGFISNSDLNWFKKPSYSILNRYAKEEYDMLIDLNINEQLPLRFLTFLSMARCKVGKYYEKFAGRYDILIESGAGEAVEYYLKTTDKYLNMINKEN